MQCQVNFSVPWPQDLCCGFLEQVGGGTRRLLRCTTATRITTNNPRDRFMGLNPTVLLLVKSTANLPPCSLVDHDDWCTSGAGQYQGGGSEGRAFRKQKREGAIRGGVSGARLPANTGCFHL